MNATVLKHYLAGLQFVFGDLEADAKPSGPLSKERLEANMKATMYAWQNINIVEKQYRDMKDVKEQNFTGTLEAIPEAGGVGTVMRTSYYKLGDKSVFTSAKKVAALDALVGKKVEIKGKPVDMELEGQHLHELWPIAVRPRAIMRYFRCPSFGGAVNLLPHH